jgi:DeoR/GlpR family transcriptional regulator of sugar metabolism
VIVGPIARLCIQGFNVDKLFIGTDGFSGKGFTGKDHLRSENDKIMEIKRFKVS